MGRFPFVTEVTENSFSLLVNQGFVDDTAEFKAFKKVATMRASFKTIGRALDSIENAEEREKAMYEVGGMILRPMLEHHDSLQPKPSLTKDEALASLFPSMDVLTGDAMVQYETDLAIELDAAAEAAGLIGAQEWGNRYAEHFREAHLQGQPSGVTRSCMAGKTTTQRELMGAFVCPRSGPAPQGARQYSRHENIVFMALKKFCCLESEAEAQGRRISATARCWEGRSQRLPTPWWRTPHPSGARSRGSLCGLVVTSD